MKATFTSRTKLLLLVATAALVAVGCGGGGGDREGIVGSDIPRSATENSGSAVAFLLRLQGSSTNETSEPIVLGDVMLAVDDNAEPVALP